MIITLHRELTEHKLAYFFLVVVMVIATLMFMAAWPSRNAQRLIGLGVAVFYLTWGIFTHWRARQMSKHLMYEYLTVALLGAVLLFLVTV